MVVVLSAPDRALVSRLTRLGKPAPQIFYWANGSLDLVTLRYWVEQAGEVVIADEIAEAVRPHVPGPVRLLSEVIRRPAPPPMPGREGPVLFFPTNDTIAKMFAPVALHLSSFAFATPVKWREEGAATTLRQLGFESIENHGHLLDQVNPSVVAFGNDWSSEEQDLIKAARQRGIPTTCLQEGCLDWGDAFARMEWVDYPMIQGAATLRYLHRTSCFATGNPRFDSLRPLPLPEQPRVMINCNFTYNVHEDARARWMSDAIGACRDAGVQFFISQHPRDVTEFPGLPVLRSGAAVVHAHLADCSLLITRFSTIVYEALLLGRPVIYYNPHGERMTTFNEDAAGGLLKAYDRAQLDRALAEGLAGTAEGAALRARFLAEHCGMSDSRAAERCAAALHTVACAGQLSDDVRRPSRNLFAPAGRAFSKLKHAILRNNSDV